MASRPDQCLVTFLPDVPSLGHCRRWVSADPHKEKGAGVWCSSQPAAAVAYGSILKEWKDWEFCNTEKLKWGCFDWWCLSLSFPLFLNSGEGEAVCWAEAHYGQAAWSRGGWAALPLPEVTAGADQEAQGPASHFSSPQLFDCFFPLLFLPPDINFIHLSTC